MSKCSILGILFLLACPFLCGAEPGPQAAAPASGPATRAAASGREAVKLVEEALRPLLPDKTVAWNDAGSERYSLVRVSSAPRQYHPDGRPVYLLRVTVDKWTGELVELRGDYADDELERLNRYRPPDVMSPEEAIALVEKAYRAVGGKLQVSRKDIDLFGRRYYVVRIYGGPPPEPRVGRLGAIYGGKLTVDGRSGEIVNWQISS